MTRLSALVTGASGFVGRHLVDHLLEIEARPIILIRNPRKVPEKWRGRVDVVECSDWQQDGIRQALGSRTFEIIYHLSSYGVRYTDRDIDEMLAINTELPTTMVRLAKERNARIVMTGTFSEYQRPSTAIPLTEAAPLEDRKIYGASKAAGGLVACAVATQLGVRLRILRLFHVFGPGEESHRLLPSLILGLSQCRRVALSAGTQIRDFVYVDDVVEALIRTNTCMAIEQQPLVDIWNVCSGVGHSVRDFALLAAQFVCASGELLGFGDLEMRSDDVPWLVGNGDRMASALGWRPVHDLRTGLRAAIATMRPDLSMMA